MKREELESWLAQRGWTKDRFGHFHKTVARRVYGIWGGNERGTPEDKARCAAEVCSGMLFKQCSRLRPEGGELCKRHQKDADAAHPATRIIPTPIERRYRFKIGKRGARREVHGGDVGWIRLSSGFYGKISIDGNILRGMRR